MSSKYLKECYLTSVYHYDALDNWSKIKVGTKLFFVKADKDDKKAKLALDQNGTKIIGELSEEDSHVIVDVLKQEHTRVFSAVISYKSDNSENSEEDRRIKVVVRIDKK